MSQTKDRLKYKTYYGTRTVKEYELQFKENKIIHIYFIGWRGESNNNVCMNITKMIIIYILFVNSREAEEYEQSITILYYHRIETSSNNTKTVYDTMISDKNFLVKSEILLLK